MVVLGEVSRIWSFLEKNRVYLISRIWSFLEKSRVDLVTRWKKTLVFIFLMEMVEGVLGEGSKRRSDLNFAHTNTNASVHQDNTMYPQLQIVYISKKKYLNQSLNPLYPRYPISQNKKVGKISLKVNSRFKLHLIPLQIIIRRNSVESSISQSEVTPVSIPGSVSFIDT